MSVVVAEGVVEITADADGIPREVGRSIDGGAGLVGAAGARSGGSFFGGFKGMLLGGLLIGGAFAIGSSIGDAIGDGLRSAVSYAVKSIDLGSDLYETQAAVGELFGTATDDVLTFGEAAVGALGQTQQQALEGARTFGVLGMSAGLADDDLASFSTDLTVLATDLASFNNTSTDEAILALGAGLRGEAEPLRRFGILLDDATLKQEALKMGIYDGTGSLSQQQRVLAANAAIYAQAGVQVGDFERTSGGLANQQRMLSAAMLQAQTDLGTALLPAITELVTFANSDLIPILNDVIEEVGPMLGDALRESTPALLDLATVFADLLPDLIVLGVSTIPVLADVLVLIAPLIKDWAANTKAVFDLISGLVDFLSGNTTFEEFGEVIMGGSGTMHEFALVIGKTIGTSVREFARFSSEVGANIRGFITGVTSIPGKVASALSGAGSWLVQTGKDIIQGLINGVTSMIGKAVKSVTDIGGAMLGGIKDFLGIRSPSTRYEHEVGEMQAEGQLRGYERKIRSSRDRVADALALPTMTETPAAMAAGLGGNTTITIGNIEIAASTVAEFMDIIELIKALPQVARSGRSVRVGG